MHRPRVYAQDALSYTQFMHRFMHRPVHNKRLFLFIILDLCTGLRKLCRPNALDLCTKKEIHRQCTGSYQHLWINFYFMHRLVDKACEFLWICVHK